MVNDEKKNERIIKGLSAVTFHSNKCKQKMNFNENWAEKKIKNKLHDVDSVDFFAYIFWQTNLFMCIFDSYSAWIQKKVERKYDEIMRLIFLFLSFLYINGLFMSIEIEPFRVTVIKIMFPWILYWTETRKYTVNHRRCDVYFAIKYKMKRKTKRKERSRHIAVHNWTIVALSIFRNRLNERANERT